MQLRAPTSCLLQSCPSQRLQQQHSALSKPSIRLQLNSSAGQQRCRVAPFGGQIRYGRYTPLWRTSDRLAQLCYAEHTPENTSFTDISTSAASSSTPTTTSVDDSRQASNAAASTSGSQTPPDSEKGSDENSFRQLLTQPAKVIAAFFQRIANFIQGLPAFVQREKLQRLHKKALDDPTNSDRCTTATHLLFTCCSEPSQCAAYITCPLSHVHSRL